MTKPTDLDVRALELRAPPWIGSVAFIDEGRLRRPAGRRRLIPLFRAFEAAGVRVHDLEDSAATADLVVVSSRGLSTEQIRRAKSASGSIVVDQTDDPTPVLHPALWREGAWRLRGALSGGHPLLNYRRTIAACDLYVGGSAAQAAAAADLAPRTWWQVDPIGPPDYRPDDVAHHADADRIRVVWEGTGTSTLQLERLRSFFERLADMNVDVTVISDRQANAGRRRVEIPRMLQSMSGHIRHVDWTLDGMREELTKSHVGLAYIDTSSSFNRAKPANKILSYWAFGLAVVATPIPSYVEVGREGEDVLFGADPRQLADHVGRLARSPELRASLGAAGYQRAWSEFSTAAFVRRYFDRLTRLGDEL